MSPLVPWRLSQKSPFCRNPSYQAISGGTSTVSDKDEVPGSNPGSPTRGQGGPAPVGRDRVAAACIEGAEQRDAVLHHADRASHQLGLLFRFGLAESAPCSPYSEIELGLRSYS